MKGKGLRVASENDSAPRWERSCRRRPLFELLGTPPEHKRRLVFPGGHSVPRTEQIKESLIWLDRYLGSVGSGAGS